MELVNVDDNDDDAEEENVILLDKELFSRVFDVADADDPVLLLVEDDNKVILDFRKLIGIIL